ncbi:hypothetical protein [Bacillus halotolerans]|uniref:CopG family transcriptional regulator n=1 Tax=Bacillus halotolerans TaxID=260554 RepID=A0ABY7I4H3_9BACI|nr:hypothetical protein [Bacillus halotolerans]MEC0253281.1 hypothetical protein [Bacillus halotolerans]MEC0359963.1 hypothetical protein [Bacillus halotolerans]UUI84982.1 hypothetical protein NPA28_03385 [Bacillus halotolerans]WAT22035.1 hypothetical protein O0R52_03375 [Bacillus halotolerans]
MASTKFSFYLNQKGEDSLNKVQKLITEKENRVTKAWIINTAIIKYYEEMKKQYHDKDDTTE